MRERLRCALLININGGTDKGNFVFVSQIIRHGQGCINASASGRFVDIFHVAPHGFTPPRHIRAVASQLVIAT
jgi:hypothetical protein